jgi:hypothetical protein
MNTNKLEFSCLGCRSFFFFIRVHWCLLVVKFSMILPCPLQSFGSCLKLLRFCVIRVLLFLIRVNPCSSVVKFFDDI